MIKKNNNKKNNNRIIELLVRNGLKVKWLAGELECHPTEVSQWISGRRSPSLSRAIKISNILGCAVEDLFPQEVE